MGGGSRSKVELMSDIEKKAIVIGLVGGIASGKSYVAEQFAALGAERIDADQVGHEVLRLPLVVRMLTREFGEHILADHGHQAREIDRARLGSLVFGDTAEVTERRLRLEAIVHPLIHARVVRKMRHIQERSNPPRAIVIDAPLLLEANWGPMCDLIIFVEAPREVRLARAVERGWTEAQFEQREAAQLPIPQKREAATYAVHSMDAIRLPEELRAIWAAL